MGRIEFNDAEQYCETSDVARFFEQYDDFDANTTPTATEVDEHILEWSAHIDRQTGHAWRTNTVVDEVKDWDGRYNWGSGRPLNLSKRHVRDFDSGQGDKLEHWDGTEWNDWLTDGGKTEGRNEDYWMDNATGILWVYDRFAFQHRPRWRLTFRYGDPSGPSKSIQMACAKFVAADLLSSDHYSMNVPGTDGSMDTITMAEQWRTDAKETIKEREEVSYVEPY